MPAGWDISSARPAWRHDRPPLSEPHGCGRLICTFGSFPRKGAVWHKVLGFLAPFQRCAHAPRRMHIVVQPTHHLLEVKTDGEPITVNGKSTEARTLPELVELLRTKQPFWPVPLVKGVKPHDMVGVSSGAASCACAIGSNASSICLDPDGLRINPCSFATYPNSAIECRKCRTWPRGHQSS